MTITGNAPPDTNRTISATVKGLYAGRSLTADDVARAIGISHGTMSGRMRCKTDWTAVEVERLSRFFKVRVDDLYRGMDGTFPGPGVNSGWSRVGDNVRVLRLALQHRTAQLRAIA